MWSSARQESPWKRGCRVDFPWKALQSGPTPTQGFGGTFLGKTPLWYLSCRALPQEGLASMCFVLGWPEAKWPPSHYRPGNQAHLFRCL